MKKLLQKIFEVSLISAFWLIVGGGIGYYFSLHLTKSITMTSKEVYKAGYSKASKECLSIIKNGNTK